MQMTQLQLTKMSAINLPVFNTFNILQKNTAY